MTGTTATRRSTAPNGALASGATPAATLRLGHWLSLPVRRRSLIVAASLVAALLVVALLTISLGRLGVAPAEIVATILGQGAGTDRIVWGTIRGPRLIVAVAAGAALGIAGTLFQTVTRNPLGSPDVIGLSAGAAAGAAAFGVLWTGILPQPVGALIGASAAMLLVYLATGRGFASPGRMLLAGIGVSAVALAFVEFVIVRVGREEAITLAAYLSGTLASRSWQHAATIWLCLVVLAPFALALSRRLQLVEMGDDQADALGAGSSRTRLFSVLVSIGLATAAVNVVGPIGFIALTAPQIARRLTRAAGPNVVMSALTGALLLCLADLLTQQSPLPVQLPVGVLTALIGGLYLGYLLLGQWKKGSL
ncbi:ferrichrome ABC transporter permease [Cryobacterium melibiosiphilum]|uniref:Ferrichrome ABC transporter permease n=1 Tax=Cryobacterium melibiosiphilum TaxID=995039 RepID=A0A3A5MKW7_9MICO|nr:iron chelate uptake ABC transporter family permease subunit [Cryobacterium melibiosiphilum]RJT87493.1 ferrichrome ABC transporter permease [Cryobacterium melibiosiphilum]